MTCNENIYPENDNRNSNFMKAVLDILNISDIKLTENSYSTNTLWIKTKFQELELDFVFYKTIPHSCFKKRFSQFKKTSLFYYTRHCKHLKKEKHRILTCPVSKLKHTCSHVVPLVSSSGMIANIWTRGAVRRPLCHFPQKVRCDVICITAQISRFKITVVFAFNTSALLKHQTV